MLGNRTSNVCNDNMGIVQDTDNEFIVMQNSLERWTFIVICSFVLHGHLIKIIVCMKLERW